MCDRGLRVRKLLGGMRIAVEGEETACGECRCREHVVQVLPGGIAIDFDGDTGIRRGGNTLSQSATTPARDPVMRPRGWARIRTAGF